MAVLMPNCASNLAIGDHLLLPMDHQSEAHLSVRTAGHLGLRWNLS